MLEIKNLTPFAAALVPVMDARGKEGATVVVKGTFALPKARAASGALAVADQQAKIELGDVPFFDPPEKSSVRYAAESSPTKAATDVVLVGHAYALGGRGETVDVVLRIGPVAKMARVFGDRKWQRAIGRWRPSDPKPFDRMPLVFERAFGGWDTTSPDPRKHAFEPRNPVGVGFAASRLSSPEGLPLPNLEDPRFLISATKDQPAPAGFGFIGPAWTPRRERAGTYDARWKKDRFPLLPLDFDPQFFQACLPDQIVRGHLQGGEPVAISNASPSRELSFTVPRRNLEITVWLRGQPTIHRPALDTFIVEPDENRALCVWKTTFPCPRQFLHIDLVRIRESAP
ncbi:MAG TPA: DUF2169 domain-containing protein [Polyangia bacterium]|nr:DUF2169 domain-containing protein [Polyangia bacterium]